MKGITRNVVFFQDAAASVLKLILPALFRGLGDQSDDVRAVAASALLPVTDSLLTSMPQQVSHGY